MEWSLVYYIVSVIILLLILCWLFPDLGGLQRRAPAPAPIPPPLLTTTAPTPVITTITESGGITGMSNKITVFIDYVYEYTDKDENMATGQLNAAQIQHYNYLLTNQQNIKSCSAPKNTGAMRDGFTYTISIGNNFIDLQDMECVPTDIQRSIRALIDAGKAKLG
jgi:hypothetical protein